MQYQITVRKYYYHNIIPLSLYSAASTLNRPLKAKRVGSKVALSVFLTYLEPLYGCLLCQIEGKRGRFGKIAQKQPNNFGGLEIKVYLCDVTECSATIIFKR